MGLLDEITGKATGSGAAAGAQPANLTGVVMDLVTNSQGGGLAELVETFKNKGLGDVVSSWVGTGQNLPISADQIRSVLGNQQIRQIAAKIGISPDVASSHLAELLPQIVDKLTPDGSIPSSSGLLEQGLNFLKDRS